MISHLLCFLINSKETPHSLPAWSHGVLLNGSAHGCPSRGMSPLTASRWAVSWVWHPVAVLPWEAKVCFASYNFASKTPCWQDTETPSWRKVVWTSPYFPCVCPFMCHPAWHFMPLQHPNLLFWTSSHPPPPPHSQLWDVLLAAHWFSKGSCFLKCSHPWSHFPYWCPGSFSHDSMLQWPLA